MIQRRTRHQIWKFVKRFFKKQQLQTSNESNDVENILNALIFIQDKGYESHDEINFVKIKNRFGIEKEVLSKIFKKELMNKNFSIALESLIKQ